MNCLYYYLRVAFITLEGICRGWGEGVVGIYLTTGSHSNPKMVSGKKKKIFFNFKKNLPIKA